MLLKTSAVNTLYSKPGRSGCKLKVIARYCTPFFKSANKQTTKLQYTSPFILYQGFRENKKQILYNNILK